MLIHRGANYIFGTCKHHIVMLWSWFPSVKTLPAYRSLRRPVKRMDALSFRCRCPSFGFAILNNWPIQILDHWTVVDKQLWGKSTAFGFIVKPRLCEKRRIFVAFAARLCPCRLSGAQPHTFHFKAKYCTGLGKRVGPRLRESRLLTPSGHGQIHAA